MQTNERRLLTYADLARFPDDGRRHEIIDGVHYVSSSPLTHHQRVAGRLSNALYNYVNAHSTGEVFTAPIDVLLSPHDIVVPDLIVVLNSQADIVREKYVAGPPAIVVEILSPGMRRRDEGAKRVLYERAGVREYWVVDPLAHTLKVFARQHSGEGFAPVLIVEGDNNAEYASPLLPGFSLNVPALFARPK